MLGTKYWKNTLGFPSFWTSNLVRFRGWRKIIQTPVRDMIPAKSIPADVAQDCKEAFLHTQKKTKTLQSDDI